MSKSIEDLFKSVENKILLNKRSAMRHHIKIADLQQDDFFISIDPGGMSIFGQVMLDIISRNNGYILCKTYSENCKEGELNSMHITEVSKKISENTFNLARTNGFKHLKKTN